MVFIENNLTRGATDGRKKRENNIRIMNIIIIIECHPCNIEKKRKIYCNFMRAIERKILLKALNISCMFMCVSLHKNYIFYCCFFLYRQCQYFYVLVKVKFFNGLKTFNAFQHSLHEFYAHFLWTLYFTLINFLIQHSAYITLIAYN